MKLHHHLVTIATVAVFVGMGCSNSPSNSTAPINDVPERTASPDAGQPSPSTDAGSDAGDKAVNVTIRGAAF
jgi:hypothetical protein